MGLSDATRGSLVGAVVDSDPKIPEVVGVLTTELNMFEAPELSKRPRRRGKLADGCSG